jgi:hypothetical protein
MEIMLRYMYLTELCVSSCTGRLLQMSVTTTLSLPSPCSDQPSTQVNRGNRPRRQSAVARRKTCIYFQNMRTFDDVTKSSLLK